MNKKEAAEYNYQSWLNYDNPDEVLLVDPITGIPVVESMPKPIESRYHEGIDAISRIPSEIEVALGAHVKSTDLDTEDDPTWFEETLQDPSLDVYMYEGYGVRRWSHAGKVLDGHILRVLPWPRKKFEERQNYALARSNVHAAPIDFRRADQLANSLDRALHEEMRRRDSTRRGLEALAVSQFVREWAMIGNIGMGLTKLDARRRGEEPESLRAMMTIGAAHQDVPRKLGQLGASISLRTLRMDEGDDWVKDNLPKIMRYGKITAEQFEAAEEITSSND